MATEEFKLKVWRCHPKAARLIPAEKTLNDTAHPGGVKFCRPFTMANSAGFWLFPPVDVDIRWISDNNFEHKLLETYSAADHHLVKSLIRPADKSDINSWCPPEHGRSKFTWGAVEPNIVQFWTGLIFETSPGWVLHVRSPINFPRRPQVSIMEGIIESDWMQYDIWLNLRFDTHDWVNFRKEEWPPIAQIIPMRRESYDADWSLEEETLNRDTPEANRVFEFWTEYNTKKFCSGGKQAMNPEGSKTKDSTTFHKTRHQIMGSAMEPNPAAICPHSIPPAPHKPMLTKFVKPKV